MDYAALIVAGVSMIFWAGFYFAIVRGRLDKHDRDNNGLGKKLREYGEREERHFRAMLAFQFHETSANERARLLAEILREG